MGDSVAIAKQVARQDITTSGTLMGAADDGREQLFARLTADKARFWRELSGRICQGRICRRRLALNSRK